MSAASFHNCLIFECNKLGANGGPPVHFSKSATVKKCTFFLSNCTCMYHCNLRSRQNPTKSILLRLELLTKQGVDAFFGGKISVFIEIHSGVLIPNDVVIISDVMACSMKTTHSTRGKSYENGLSPFARVPSCNVLLLILLTLAPRQRFLCVFIMVAFL